MSRFQVGDKVQVNGHYGTVEDDRRSVLVTLDDGGEFSRWWWHEDVLTPVSPEPSVLDVDGNPIRVGQLVESIGEKADPNYWTLSPAWVEDVRPGSTPPQPQARVNGYWVKSRSLRVVTETFRAPEPDTRTVEARVALKTQHTEGISDAIYSVVSELMDVSDVTVTVEVVE